MFVRVSPLLDILHCYFLHGSPRHDVLFFTPPLQKEKFPVGFLRAIKPGWESFLGVASLSSAPLRDPWTQQMLFSPYVKFPVQHAAAQKKKKKLIVARLLVSSTFLSRWRLQPNSQPIPARPLPFEQLGLCSMDQPSSVRADHRLQEHPATGSIPALKAVLTWLSVLQTIKHF